MPGGNSIGNALIRAAVCVVAILCGTITARPASAGALAAQSAMPPACDRQCLYGFLDQYLTALKAKDPSRLPLAQGFRYSENNVRMGIGDGVWGTITSLGDYRIQMADTTNGEIGCYGIVQETNTTSIYALRLKVADGKFAEAEILIHRSESGTPFPSHPVLNQMPVLEELVPADERSPRERMIALADGYFNTLQLNDGVLFTQFDDNCNRIENGLQTTHNPDLMKTIPVANLGCAQQFKLGNYRYDDRVRDRRFFLVDQERGLIMTAGFIDHAGRLENFTLTDGTAIKSPIRTPSTLCFLELFKIRGGKIQQILSVFNSVPYNMPSPWVADPSR